MKLAYAKNAVHKNSQISERNVLLIIRNGRYSSVAHVDTTFLNTAVTSLKIMFCRNYGKRLVTQLW